MINSRFPRAVRAELVVRVELVVRALSAEPARRAG